MKVPYFIWFTRKMLIGNRVLNPYYLTKEAEYAAANQTMIGIYRYDRFRVWRWIGAL